MNPYENCHLCPRECGANRTAAPGFCLAGSVMRISRAALHTGEEPCICTGAGSGAIFFSGCPLKCVFCQNSAISSTFCGKEYTPDELAEKMLSLQEENACCIDLVSPTPFLPSVISALKKAKRMGLTIPIVYNTSGYEKTDSLRQLDGLIDIYLPDFKYRDSALSERCSRAADYFSVCAEAISEMLRQTGKPLFEGESLRRGTIIRHLILPGQTKDSKALLAYLGENYPKDAFLLSLMNQYFPAYRAAEFPDLNRRLTTLEYQSVARFAEKIGFQFIYTQQRASADAAFVPDFDTDMG